MVLTDKQIRELAQSCQLISPFEEQNLQSESYDVTLGNQIAVQKKEIRCLDIADPKIDASYSQSEMDADGYVISPKEYVLVSLQEHITLPENLTAHLRPKTSFTRLGLIVSGQHCNSTYSGVLWVGLFNATNYPIRIHKGFSIAQIVFEQLVDIPSPDKQYKSKKNAHYQGEDGEFRGAKFDAALLDDIWSNLLK